MEFRITQKGPERSDCTAPYKVEITEPGTVGEFIDAVLKNHSKDWGYIGIKSNVSTFGDPHMEYKWGDPINREALSSFENRKIQAIYADGGWSRMDYVLEVM